MEFMKINMSVGKYSFVHLPFGTLSVITSTQQTKSIYIFYKTQLPSYADYEDNPHKKKRKK